MIDSSTKNIKAIIHQENNEETIAEQSIVVKVYSDNLVELSQHGNEIDINPETIPDLIKVLRDLKKGFDKE